MKLVLIIASAIAVCQASVFVNAPKGKGCTYPNWKCDCKLVYRCDQMSGFPNDFSDAGGAGYIKDLAPKNYQLRIPGKRWRRNIWSQEEFCKRECYDRMNAFLCLQDNGTPSGYSYSAICMKLLGTASGPFAQDGSAEPCCEIYLQWGLNWCPDKWHMSLTSVRCLSRGVDASFGDNSPSGVVSHVFSAEGSCDTTNTDFTWCDSAPMCSPQTPSDG